MNFKIRVKENIGFMSLLSFGVIGTEHVVENGSFEDLQGEPWGFFGELNDIKSINFLFSSNYLKEYKTVFELAE